MRVQIDKIKVNPGRREALPEHIEELSQSIAEVGLLNPITVDREFTLIAGLHRLEAVKRLGWAEIECTVSSLEGLQAELAEIDENFVRQDLSTVEFGELLLRRKEIYETLHPETRNHIAQATAMNRVKNNNVSGKMPPTTRPFTEDTADKLGVSRTTVERQIRIAKNLTPETKEIIRGAEISKKTALKLSRLSPEQQIEAANLLVSAQIKSIDEYDPGISARTVDPASGVSKEIAQSNPRAASDGQATSEIHAQPENPPVKDRQNGVKNLAPAQQKKMSKEKKMASSGTAPSPEQQIVGRKFSTSPDPPYSLGSKRYATIKESVADLKDPRKDCSCTPDSFLAEIDAFVKKFKQEIEWFQIPYYVPALPRLTRVQLDFFIQRMDSICDAARQLTTHVKEGWSNHGEKT